MLNGVHRGIRNGFNPAEAEEGFRRFDADTDGASTGVSIQPKPKKGLEGLLDGQDEFYHGCFNPAEAEEGFRRTNTTMLR